MSSFHNRFKGVPEGNRAKTHPVFDELVSIEVPRMASFTAGDEPRGLLRKLVGAFRVGVSAARDQGVRLGLQRARLREVLAVSGVLAWRRNSIGMDFICAQSFSPANRTALFDSGGHIRELMYDAERWLM